MNFGNHDMYFLWIKDLNHFNIMPVIFGILVLALFGNFSDAFADSFTSRATGFYDLASTWNDNNGDPAVAPPGPDDEAIIAFGHTVTIRNPTTISTLGVIRIIGDLIIDSEITNNGFDGYGVINEGGIVTFTSNAIMQNNGLYDNLALTTIAAGAVFNNGPGVNTHWHNEMGTVNVEGRFVNYADIHQEFDGKMVIKSTGWFTNTSSTGVFGNNGISASVTIEAGGIFQNQNQGIINNSATITNNSNSFSNGIVSTINNLAGSVFTNAGVFTNSGKLDNKGGGTVNNSGTIDSTGTLENSGTFDNKVGAVLMNFLDINNSGSFINDGSIIGGVAGTINNNSGGSINNNIPGTIDNSNYINNNSGGIIHNKGNLDNNSAGTIVNTGTIDNTKFMFNKLDGTILNQIGGIINNTDGIITNRGVINNIGGNMNNAINLSSYPFGTIKNEKTIFSSGTINNISGTIEIFLHGTIESSGTLQNSSNIVNVGELNIKMDGILYNNSGAIIDNQGTLQTIVGGGIINNSGFIDNHVSESSITINLGGTFNNFAILTSSEKINNFGTIINSGIINSSGGMDNQGILTIFGVFVNSPAFEIMFNYGTINLTGTFNNVGDHLNSTGIFIDCGTIIGNEIGPIPKRPCDFSENLSFILDVTIPNGKSMTVKPGAVITINPGVTLDIDKTSHIIVESGGGIKIISGGKVIFTDRAP